MGNNNAKKGNLDAFERHLEELFLSLSRGKSFISLNVLKENWSPFLDPHLYRLIETRLTKVDGKEIKSESFKSFYIGLVKGSAYDRSENVLKLISSSKDHASRDDLLQFITSALRSVFIIQESKLLRSFSSWHKRKTRTAEDSIPLYGLYLLHCIDRNEKSHFNANDISILLTHFDVFLSMILACIYRTEEDDFFAHLLPVWRYMPIESGRKLEDISVLDLVRIMFINSELPVDYQSEWRLLFSTSIDGESFSRLSGQITNKGPTVIIVKDKGGNVFGGFAPDSWSMGPNFKGDSTSFLFTLFPEIKMFQSSNFNSNYQYMNTCQQTMPNGLGMGGKLEYYGMWLSAEFGVGSCSESCTTYRNYQMMSSTKSFSVAHLEVWGVGPPPPTPAELGERSILDGNVEAKALLELAGKTTYSEGYREKPNDLDSEPT